MAVLADDDDRLHVVLENMGLLPYFDFVLTSREVRACAHEVSGLLREGDGRAGGRERVLPSPSSMLCSAVVLNHTRL